MTMQRATCVSILALCLAGGAFAQTTPAPDASATGQTPAPAPTPPPTGFFNKLKYSGLIDVNATHNFNDPASKINTYRNFDYRANTGDLNYGEFALEYAPAPIGFRVDVGGGRTTQLVQGAEQAGDWSRYVQQAYVSLKPASWKGVQVDFGKFVTTAGAEVIETHSNWNYSRSLLFAWAIPYYHLGLRTSVPVGKTYTAGFQLLNGWNDVKDNNSGKTFAYTGAVAKTKFQWFHNYYVGPEKPDTNNGMRQLFDTTLLLTPNPKVNFYINYDIGADKRITSGSDMWYGLAGAARVQVNKIFAIAPRLEFFKDRDGFATGTAQTLKEFTLTGEFKLPTKLNFLSRVEYRHDWSDVAVFDKKTGANVKDQDTFLVGLIFFFEYKK
jgi:putative OmpL-like beta-barrel porin-2